MDEFFMENETKKSDTALREEKVLEFWRENKIFSKTLSKTKGKKEFIFYEGPPTANGKPGIHHLEALAFKDAIPRYKTMRGYHVRRKGGWDTHGLAVEIQTEKELGLDSKIAIEKYGQFVIDLQFNTDKRKKAHKDFYSHLESGSTGESSCDIELSSLSN